MTRDMVQSLQHSCSCADGKLDLKSLGRKRCRQKHRISPNGVAGLAIGTQDFRKGPGARKCALMPAVHLSVCQVDLTRPNRSPAAC